jgi:hypothetical protein
MDITLKPGVWIDPEKYVKQIADAGYAARKEDIRLTLTGSLAKEGDQLVFTMTDVGSTPVKFTVTEGRAKDANEAKQMMEAYKAAENLAGQAVELEGWWRPAKQKAPGSMAELAVVRVSPLPARKE